MIEVKQEKGAIERLTLADQPLQRRDSFFGSGELDSCCTLSCFNSSSGTLCRPGPVFLRKKEIETFKAIR
jgi:hypothetical protein